MPLQPSRETALGLAWAGNSVNCVPFRCAPALAVDAATIVAYYDDAGDVQIVRIDRDGSTRRTGLTTQAKPYDAHQSISLARTPDGLIHAAFGAHASTLFWTCTDDPTLERGFRETSPLADRQTYPMFVELGGETFLLARRGAAADGEIFVHRWNGAWTIDERPIISGESRTWTAGPYLNSPMVYREGRGVGLFLVWRLTGAATSAGRVVNVGVDFTQTLDGFRSLQTISGVKQSLPMTPATSERVVPVPIGASLINQASAAVRSDGTPAFVTYWGDGEDPIQYRLGWRQGANWRVKKISRFRTKFSLQGDGTLPLPHSRPELLFDAHDNAIVLYRSRERGNALMATLLSAPGYDMSSARECVLAADDLGFYEPIVNRQAWARDSTLGVYVQRCNQVFADDGKRTLSSAPARYLEWRYADLKQASQPLAR